MEHSHESQHSGGRGKDREMLLLDQGYRARFFFKRDADMVKMSQRLQYGRKHWLQRALFLGDIFEATKTPEMRNSEASAAQPQVQALTPNDEAMMDPSTESPRLTSVYTINI